MPLTELIKHYRINPTDTRQKQTSRALSLIEQGLDIMARVLAGGIPVARKEALRCIAKLPHDPEDILKKSLRSLEQSILRECYQTEIANIRRRLAIEVMPCKEIVNQSHPDMNQLKPLSHEKRMEAKLITLESLLENNPLKNSRQRRREIAMKK